MTKSMLGALLLLSVLTGCNYTVPLFHRRHVNTELAKIRERQERPRVIVIDRRSPSEGRALGLALAAKVEGGQEVDAEQARFRALPAEEQEQCLATYVRHAPESAQGKLVLEGLWSQRDR